MNMNILLIGAGGHALACIDVIESLGNFQIIGLVGQPDEIGQQRFGYKVLASDSMLIKLLELSSLALISVGQIKTSNIRAKLFMQAVDLGFIFPKIVSPFAYVSPHAKIGDGTIVMHGAVINAAAEIGENCIINSCALIEHGAKIGSHCHISTGAIVNGDVTVGAGSFLGSRCVIREGLLIGGGSIIGMGALIKFDLSDNSTFHPD